MAAIGDLIPFVVVAFLIVAGLSLLTIGAPATPPFARRAATSATVQLRQDPNAGFIIDRGFLFRRRFWFVGTCCAPVRVEAEQYRQLGAAQHRQPGTGRPIRGPCLVVVRGRVLLGVRPVWRARRTGS